MRGLTKGNIPLGLTCTQPALPIEYALKNWLINDLGLSQGDFQEPIVETRFIGGTPQRITLGADDCSQGKQIYQATLRFAERCLTSHSAPCDAFKAGVRGAVAIPWLGGNPMLENWAWGKLDELKNALHAQGFTEFDPEFYDQLVQSFIRALFQPPEVGGFGLTFDPSDTSLPRSFAQITPGDRITCLDFVILCKALAPYLEVPCQPVELYRDATGASRNHVMVEFINPLSQQPLLADYSEATSQAPEQVYVGPPRIGDVAAPISWLEVENLYYTRRGFITENEADLDSALRFSEHHLTYVAKAILAEERGDYPTALESIEKAIRIYPNYPDAVALRDFYQREFLSP